MGFLICAGALLLIIFGFCFYSYSFSLDLRNAKIAKAMLIIFGILGAVLSCFAAALFFVLLPQSKVAAGEKDVIKDVFVLFASVDIIIIALGLVITLLSSVLKSILRPVIPIVLPLWGIISLFWCAVCCAWSEFESFSATAFILLFGIGASLLLAFSALPQIIERNKILSDPEKRNEIIGLIRQRKAKKEGKRAEKKRLKEQKKRLKHPKR